MVFCVSFCNATSCLGDSQLQSNGVPIAHYEYDENGNRTYALTIDREVSNTFDDQDRLLESTINSLPATYTYTATRGMRQTRESERLFDASRKIRNIVIFVKKIYATLSTLSRRARKVQVAEERTSSRSKRSL